MNFQDKTRRLDRVKSVLWLQIHLAPTRIAEADSLFSHNFPAELSAFGLNRCPQFTVSNQSDRQVKGWAAGDQKIFPRFFQGFQSRFYNKIKPQGMRKDENQGRLPTIMRYPKKETQYEIISLFETL
jgi:hypothetical protein